MERSELDEWANDFESFHGRFVPLFGRRETRQQAVKYLYGPISAVERKNSWRLAKAAGDKTPDATQRLLYGSKWYADAARDELQRFVIEQFGDVDGISVVDETDFLRKGEKLAGVQRQYSGTAGKTDLAELTVPEVRRLLEIALPLSAHSPELRLARSIWRRAKRQLARVSHRRRRLGQLLYPYSAQPP